jgi:MFS family permease
MDETSDALESHTVAWWMFAIFLLGAAEGIVGTYFPIVFLELGGSLVGLSIFIAFISLIGMTQIIWIEIINHKGRPKQLGAISLGLNSLFTALMGITGNARVFGSSRIGSSLTTAIFNTANVSLRTTFFSLRKNGRIGNLFMGYYLMGMAITVLLGGLLYEIIGLGVYRELHIISGVFLIIAGVIMWKFIPEYNIVRVEKSQEQYNEILENIDLDYSFKDQIKLFRMSEGLTLFFFGSLIFNFGVGVSAPYFVVDMNQRWALSMANIGVLTTFNVIMMVLIIFLFLPIVDIIDRKTLYTIGIALAASPAYAILLEPEWVNWFISSFWYWMFVYFWSSIGWGIISALVVTLIIDYVHPKIRLKVIVYYGAAFSLFTALASLLAGLLMHLFDSYFLIFLASTLIRTVGLILIWFNVSPPIPFADFYERRRIFITRFTSTMERGLMTLPIVSKRIKKQVGTNIPEEVLEIMEIDESYNTDTSEELSSQDS